MNISAAFSSDYPIARERFRKAAARLEWQLEAHPLSGSDSDDTLTMDVAISPGESDGRVLVLSSGLHGVEGYFGSAVQLAMLQQWNARTPPSVKCVFLHGLNPFGFAGLRRFDKNNIDPNRNFLLPSEQFEGAPPGYAELDGLLNPLRPPSRWEPFTLKALWQIARHGMPALRQAVAAGQYEFPQGLFFGGSEPSWTQQILDANMGRWLQGSRLVAHLDFHTGLGPWGTYKLLIDYALDPWQRERLTDWFGAEHFEASADSSIAYDARGGFGRWCVNRDFAARYLFACAEFGTYGPLAVLAGLRAENQAHHWAAPEAACPAQTKRRLLELFCPASQSWRSQVVEAAIELVSQTTQGLESQPV